MTKMIPPVPTSAVMLPTPKQKIGFSIESIVGNDAHTTTTSPTTTTTNTTTNPNEISHALNAVGKELGCHRLDKLSNNNTSNNNNNNSNNNNNNNNNHEDSYKISNGPSSPPQTPPGNLPHLIGSTNLPTTPPHLTTGSLFSHNSHLSLAQQHALHQHIMQQQQQQQHHQQHPSNIRSDFKDIIQRLHNNAANNNNNHNNSSSNNNAVNLSSPNSAYSPTQTRLSFNGSPLAPVKRERSPTSAGLENELNPPQRHHSSNTPPRSVSPISSHPSSPPSMLPSSPLLPPVPMAQHFPKLPGGPLLVPGIPMPSAGLVRPFPVGPGGPPPPPPPPPGAGPQPGLPDIKALPPYINAPPELPPQHNPHLIAAAQFQMAAALQAGHVLGPAAAAAAAAGLPPHAPFMPGHPGLARETYPLYPWLLTRHGRIFPHRFPGNFLLQPFRKPKRIRTAFSPSQLLKLEHAFESNQYVVGAERKALAQSLNLSETQVKVWFQNRRTKHKRMQQEDDKGGGNSSDRRNTNCDEDEDDELIDMDMDDECPSDEEQHEYEQHH